MTDQELEQLLQDLKRFDDAYDELDARMRFLTWPEWGAVRTQRDSVGEAYIAISDRLAAEGYRVRWNKESKRYEAQLIAKPEMGELIYLSVSLTSSIKSTTGTDKARASFSSVTEETSAYGFL